MCIKFNFHKNLIYMIINLFAYITISTVVVTKSEVIFLKDLCFFIAFIISMYCLSIQNKFSKTSNNQTKLFRDINEKENENKMKKEKFKTYFSIIIIHLLFYIVSIVYEFQLFNEIIIYPFLSNMSFIGILISGYHKKGKLGSHHKLSFIILFFAIFFSPSLYEAFNSTKKNMFIFNALYSFFFYYIIGLIRAVVKRMMENNFISPFFITALNSIFRIIVDFFIYGYYYFIAEEQVRISYFQKNLTENFQNINLIHMILYCFGIIIYLIFDILIGYFNSPYHQSVCDVLAIFIGTIIQFSIGNIIIMVINLFFSCVAAEIIILKFCNLDKNTIIEIQSRASERISINLSFLNKSNVNDMSISFSN